MGTRSYAQVAPTAASMAMNASIFGYGGHSLVTPHSIIKQLWWTEERIEAKVTRSYVLSKLRREERDFLDRPVMFGEEEGLTDDTYMEWILEKAKRLFLILAETGVPDQIFGCIDDSWDDEDLPIARDDVEDLRLAATNDELLNQKFFDTQFVYLLRELTPGAHIDYGPKEHIPMEYVPSAPPAVSLQIWDRVHFPEKPDETFMRRKYPLIDKETGHDYRKSFMRDVRKAQELTHEHIAPVWASYTAENSAYVISDFVGEHTLRSFIDHRMPTQFQRVQAAQRPVLLCEWMHCLSDALASLHHRGTAHGAIRPSNIIIDRSNRIAFSDIGTLRTFQRLKKVNKIEIYDYAAPESHHAKPPSTSSSGPPVSSAGAFSRLRKMSSGTSSSSGSSAEGSTRSNSIITITDSPITPPCGDSRSNSMNNTTIASMASMPVLKSSGSFRNFSRRLDRQISFSESDSPLSPVSTTSTTRTFPPPSVADTDLLRDLREASEEMSDIFSLGCIFIDILTFMIKGKNNDFIKFRTTRVTSSASGKQRARTDTSFHSDPDKIHDWMAILQTESLRHNQQVLKAVPELLRLVKRMMSPDASLRPPAIQVRDRIQQILIGESGVEKLCCAGREWHVPPLSKEYVVGSRSFYDAMSAATGVSPVSSKADRELPRSVSRAESQMTTLTITQSNTGSIKNRWRGSANTGTKRISSLRRVFSKSSTA